MTSDLLYVTKADAAFSRGASALITSIQRLDPLAEVVVLDAGLTAEQVRHFEGRGVCVRSIELRHHARLPSLVGTHYNDSIFALMHIGDLDAERFVHLDADTVLFPPFRQVVDALDTNDFVGVADHPVLSVADNIGSSADQSLVAEGFDLREGLDGPAVNAGVFGADMATFRRMLVVMQRAYEMDLELPRRDQTLLNIALSVVEPNRAVLPIHFNFRPSFRRDPSIRLEDVRRDGDLLQPLFAEQPIGVMHYIGPSKPWMLDFDRSSLAHQVWAQFSDEGDRRGTAAAVR